MYLKTAKQLKYHNFAVEQQPHLSLPENASQVSRTAFLSYLVENYGTQLKKGSVLFIYDPLANKYISLYTILYFTHYQKLYLKSLTEYCMKYNLRIEKKYLKSLLSNFLNALQLHLMLMLHLHEKRAGQEIEGFTHLLKMFISSVTDADFIEAEILDSLRLLSWYIHRFCKIICNKPTQRLTNFVIAGQQYCFKRLFYGISVGPAAFSSFMSSICKPLIRKNKIITYLDDFFIQDTTTNTMLQTLTQYLTLQIIVSFS